MARTHVVISEEVLAAIDEAVGKRGRSRSFEQAAVERLERLALDQALGATAGIARGSAYSHWQDLAAAAAWVQKTRRTESQA